MSGFPEDPPRQRPELADDPAGQATSEHGPRLAQRARTRPTAGGRPHGKKSSWALTGLVVAAFVAGGVGLILHLWWLVFACAGVVVASVPAGKLIRIMDDTVVWSTTPGDHPSAPESQR